MTRKTTFLTSVLATGAALALAWPAMAEDVGDAATDMTQSEATQENAEAADMTDGSAEVGGYTDDELRPFVEAALTLSALRQTYALRLADAQSDEARQALVDQATAEMRTAVEETDGIDLETYEEIGRAASENDALNQRITEIAQSMIPAEGGVTMEDDG